MLEDAEESTDLSFHSAASESNKMWLLSIYQQCLTYDLSETKENKRQMWPTVV